ncbi:hypothetical protein DXG01_015101 [Tephrocybe rancida]|nr:hypothetical protein DXG01_015101 [Tephrocybe rancida]
MNVPTASNAVQTNDKLLRLHARKLASDDFESYSTFAERFAKWLEDDRAYYTTARPKIAQTTLRRNAVANSDLKTPFHISSCLNHPMAAYYARLLKVVHPHRERFVEPELSAEIKALIKTITQPAIHIDLTEEPNSPVTTSQVHVASPAIQPSSSSLASALRIPSVSPADSVTLPFVSSPPQSTTYSNHAGSAPSASVNFSEQPHDSFKTPALVTSSVDHVGKTMNNSFPTPPLDFEAAPSAMSSQPLSAPLDTPQTQPSMDTGQAGPSIQPPMPTNAPAAQPITSIKRRKKKSIFGLDSLIQADIQDLQKRGSIPNIKMEATDTAPNLFTGHTSQDGVSHPEIIVIDDDDDVGPPPASEPAPLPASSSDMQLATPSSTSESFNATRMIVEETFEPVQPRHAEQSTNNTDFDTADGTQTVLKDDLPTQPSLASTLTVHGWTPLPTDTPSTDVQIPIGGSTLETTSTPLANVARESAMDVDALSPDAMDIDECRPHVSKNAPSQLTTSGAGVNGLGHLPAPMHATPRDGPSVPTQINGLRQLATESRIETPENLPYTIPQQGTMAGSVASTSEHTDASPTSSTIDGNTLKDTLMAPPETLKVHVEEPPAPIGAQSSLTNACTTTAHNGTLGETSSTSIGLNPEVVAREVEVDTMEELKALNAFGPDTRTLMVQKGEKRKRLRSKIKFEIREDQLKAINRWNNRKDLAEASARSEQKNLAEISDLPVAWPSGGALCMNVIFKGRRTTFPLSPPFMVGPNGLVDVSEYICLGENLIELEQFNDMSAHILVLRVHHPTEAQLRQARLRRQKDQAWNDWLQKMAQPLYVPITSFSDS